MSPPALQLRPATPADIPLIQSLAHRIWQHSYPGILSQEQIDYMLGQMYSTPQIESEMTLEDPNYFLLLLDQQSAGFAALGTADHPAIRFLHKLYLLPALQGCGLGSQALSLLKSIARQQGASRLILRVNRHNLPALRCYEKNGFVLQRSLVSDIGHGFLMDDHEMCALLVSHP